MDGEGLRDFARRYTGAWCSQEPGRVAAFFAGSGSLTINAGAPAVGREAIGKAAAGFMATFPDLVLTMDGIRGEGERAVYRWTLTGTSAGRRVVISGFEEWEFGADGLIARSRGQFDEGDYRRQLEFGFGR